MRLSHRLRAIQSGRPNGDRLAAGSHGDDLGSFSVAQLYEHRTLESFSAYLEAEGASGVALAAAEALRPRAPDDPDGDDDNLLLGGPHSKARDGDAGGGGGHRASSEEAPPAGEEVGRSCFSTGEAELLRAAGRGQARLVAALVLDAGVPPDCGVGRQRPGSTPLLLACGGGHSNVVRVLLVGAPPHPNPNLSFSIVFSFLLYFSPIFGFMA